MKGITLTILFLNISITLLSVLIVSVRRLYSYAKGIILIFSVTIVFYTSWNLFFDWINPKAYVSDLFLKGHIEMREEIGSDENGVEETYDAPYFIPDNDKDLPKVNIIRNFIIALSVINPIIVSFMLWISNNQQKKEEEQQQELKEELWRQFSQRYHENEGLTHDQITHKAIRIVAERLLDKNKIKIKDIKRELGSYNIKEDGTMIPVRPPDELRQKAIEIVAKKLAEKKRRDLGDKS